MSNDINRFARTAALLVALLTIPAVPASAQGYISPLLGFNFGGDSGCPELTGCEDKRLNVGVGLGALGNVFGFEWEFAYANDFFGDAEGLSSSVLTMMANAMFVPDIGPIRPYGLVGLGLIKTNIEELRPSDVLTSDNNHFGWNLGGGLMIFFGDHVGVRGDIRYFHAFQDLELLGFTLADAKLDFGRAAGAVVFKF